MSELSLVGLARASDAREIAEMSRDLIEQGLTWSWTPARVQHFISGERLDGDRRPAREPIAAFAIMHFGDEVAHLNLLAVATVHRRAGLGHPADELADCHRDRPPGVFRINLELRTHNEEARAFYERLGFEQLGVVPGYYQGREAALRMSRRLDKSQP
jgi:ribosomal protein S18 acetylase RimI-like enzyme